MKKLFTILSLSILPLNAQTPSDFKVREIAVTGALRHERKCETGKRGKVTEVEIDEMVERPIGLYAGATSLGDVATLRKDTKEGKTYVSLSLCLPEGSEITSVIIPGKITHETNANCSVDEISAMDTFITVKDKYGVPNDIAKAFRPIDFEESSLCESKRKMDEVVDTKKGGDPEFELPADNKQSEYGQDKLKVEHN